MNRKWIALRNCDTTIDTFTPGGTVVWHVAARINHWQALPRNSQPVPNLERLPKTFQVCNDEPNAVTEFKPNLRNDGLIMLIDVLLLHSLLYFYSPDIRANQEIETHLIKGEAIFRKQKEGIDCRYNECK